MARLCKKKRDELKAAGLWRPRKVKPPEYVREVSFEEGKQLFCQLAEEANRTPVPKPGFCASVSEPKCSWFYPDLFSYEYGIASSIEAFDTPEFDGFYLKGDDFSDSREMFAAAIFSAIALRVAETHQLLPASQVHDLLAIPIPREFAPMIGHIGAFLYENFEVGFVEPEGFVKRCMRSILLLEQGHSWIQASKAFVLPISPKDPVFNASISSPLNRWIVNHLNIDVPEQRLVQTLFSGFLPDEIQPDKISTDVWEMLKPFFQEVKDGPSFRKRILVESASVLTECRISLPILADEEFCFQLSVKEMLRRCSSRTIQVSPSFQESMVYPDDPGVAFKGASPGQCTLVEKVGGKTICLTLSTLAEEDMMDAAASAVAFGCTGRVFQFRMSHPFEVPFDPDGIDVLSMECDWF